MKTDVNYPRQWRRQNVDIVWATVKATCKLFVTATNTSMRQSITYKRT